MRSIVLVFVVCACAAAPTVHFAAEASPVPPLPGRGCLLHATPVTGDRTLTSSGRTRRFRLVLPEPLPAGPMPLVLNIHGLVETPSLQQWYSRMDGPARARGMAVVYPQGVGNSWNAGTCCGRARDEQVADVRFLRDLVRELDDELCIDRNRIYATGLSNGAFMSYRLACEAPDLIAAIAPVAGVEAVTTCTPSRPVPVLAFNGTNDPLVHYGGGWFGLISVDETMSRWSQRNSCRGPPAQVVYERGDTHCVAAPSCAAETILCRVEGQGHTWPGAALPMFYLGGTTSDVDASSTILDFFLAHPKSM
jgi:polyhydroxybutyrate depolymerase